MTLWTRAWASRTEGTARQGVLAYLTAPERHPFLGSRCVGTWGITHRRVVVRPVRVHAIQVVGGESELSHADDPRHEAAT